MVEPSLIHEDYTPNPADTQHTCARPDTRGKVRHTHTHTQGTDTLTNAFALHAHMPSLHTHLYSPFRKAEK